MKKVYTAEMYREDGEVKRIGVLANPEHLEMVALHLLGTNGAYAGVRFLREEMKPQVVEVLHYRRKDGMIRAVWRE